MFLTQKEKNLFHTLLHTYTHTHKHTHTRTHTHTHTHTHVRTFSPLRTSARSQFVFGPQFLYFLETRHGIHVLLVYTHHYFARQHDGLLQVREYCFSDFLDFVDQTNLLMKKL
jgi:hypothetical protein